MEENTISKMLKEYGRYQTMLSKVMDKQHKFILYKNIAVVDASFFLKIYDMLSPEQKENIEIEEIVSSAFNIGKK